MLVLSRNEGQEIKIGDDVIIRICAIARGKVRIGIKAPRQIEIIRTELLPAKQERADHADHN